MIFVLIRYRVTDKEATIEKRRSLRGVTTVARHSRSKLGAIFLAYARNKLRNDKDDFFSTFKNSSSYGVENRDIKSPLKSFKKLYISITSSEFTGVENLSLSTSVSSLATSDSSLSLITTVTKPRVLQEGQ